MKTKTINFLKQAYWFWGLASGYLLFWSLDPAREIYFSTTTSYNINLDKFIYSIKPLSFSNIQSYFIWFYVFFAVNFEIIFRILNWSKNITNSKLKTASLIIFAIITIFFISIVSKGYLNFLTNNS